MQREIFLGGQSVIGSRHFPEHMGRRKSLLNDIADNMSAFKMHNDIPQHSLISYHVSIQSLFNFHSSTMR